MICTVEGLIVKLIVLFVSHVVVFADGVVLAAAVEAIYYFEAFHCPLLYLLVVFGLGQGYAIVVGGAGPDTVSLLVY